MGKSNPSSRGYPVPTMVSSREDNQELFGGNSKAGIGGFTGYSAGAHNAIVNGSGGRSAPRVAGPNYPRLGELNYIRAARDLKGDKIRSPDGKHLLYYPINFNNQLSGIVNPSSRYGPTRAPADGVNLVKRRAAGARVAAWNRKWPQTPVRDTPNSKVSLPLRFF